MVGDPYNVYGEARRRGPGARQVSPNIEELGVTTCDREVIPFNRPLSTLARTKARVFGCSHPNEIAAYRDFAESASAHR